MKLIGRLDLPALVFHLTAFASSDKVLKQEITSRGKKRTYYLFAPGTINAASPAPLIVLLHGSGRNGLSLVEKWKDLASRERVIIVGPDAAGPAGWAVPQDGPDFIHDLVESLKAKYPINPRKVYLFGHSAGAVFALTLSMLESEYFAATAVHAGAWRDEKEFQAIDYSRRKIPVAIFVGDNDHFFPLPSVKSTGDALKQRGFPVDVTVMKGHNHWYYDLAPGINQNAWLFLNKHELAEDQRYVSYGSAAEISDANKILEEVNLLKGRANELTKQFGAREAELKGKDFTWHREQIKKIAQEQVRLLNEGAAVLRAAADKAYQASKLKMDDKFKEYLLLTAQADRKSAEVLDLLREQAEMLLGDHPPAIINAKRNEAREKVERLQKAADELARKAEQMRGHGK